MASKSGFCLGGSGALWIKLLKQLQSDLGVEFSLLSGSDDLLVEPAFASAIKQQTLPLYRGVGIDGIHTDQFQVDSNVLADFREAELVCMEIADRMDQGYSFSRHERERLYIQSLNLWLNTIEQLQPDFIIFPTTPHSLVEYVLYAVAEKKRIPMLMFTQVTAIERVLAYTDYKDVSKNIVSSLANFLEEEHSTSLLSEDLQDYVEKFSQGYADVIPRYLKERLEQHSTASEQGLPESESTSALLIEKLSQVGRYPEYAKRLATKVGEKVLKKTTDKTTRKTIPNYLKMPHQAFDQEQGLTVEQWHAYKARAKEYKEQLMSSYQQYCVSADISKNFVYVPMHYQPERTTCPEGGRYSNQVLMLNVLSRCIPDDWNIIVKENPSQLLPQAVHGERGRYAYVYEDIASIPKVSIVAIETDQFELIENCRAVATLTGTTGWEALMKHKPVISFGHAWYAGCEGVFSVQDIAACQQAVESIEEGFSVDVKKVRCFLAAVDQHSFKGFVNLKRYKDPVAGEQNNFDNMLPIMKHFVLTGEVKFKN